MTVTQWDLSGHRQQNFHSYGDDPTEVMDTMTEWMAENNIFPNRLVDIRVSTFYDETEGPSIEGVVEYTDTAPPTIRDIQWDCWKVAEDHGWHDDLGDHTFVEKLCLVHSEVSEALEEHRNGRATDEVYHVNGKPEGVPIELADAMIRLFDLAEIYNIDLGQAIDIKQAYNRTRPFRHGGKRI